MHPPWPEITRSTGTFRTFRSMILLKPSCAPRYHTVPQPRKILDTGIVRYRVPLTYVVGAEHIESPTGGAHRPRARLGPTRPNRLFSRSSRAIKSHMLGDCTIRFERKPFQRRGLVRSARTRQGLGTLQTRSTSAPAISISSVKAVGRSRLAASRGRPLAGCAATAYVCRNPLSVHASRRHSNSRP